MLIHIIRHGKTKGNFEKRYIGTTDESLAEQSLLDLKPFTQKMDAVYSSPLLRCRQTATLLFPKNTILVANNLKECHFGDFENKNYDELKDLVEYKNWINGKIPVPNGENNSDFKKRCSLCFKAIVEKTLSKNKNSIAIIAHGGTIMSIMEAFAIPEKQFYDWQPPNNSGFIVETDIKTWKKQTKVTFIKEII